MKQTILLSALSAALAVVLFGCSSSNTTTGFSGMEVALSGQYLVLSKDPGIYPGFNSLQLFQNGKSLEAIDNLGQTWTGTLSNLTLYGATPTGAEADQQQQQQIPGQQPQQTTEPESFHGEIYLETYTRNGKVSMTGVIETSADVALPTTDGQQQQTTTTSARTLIAATIIDERSRAGSVSLYNTYAPTTTQTQP